MRNPIDMTPGELSEWLKEIGACSDARKLFMFMSGRQALEYCPYVTWLRWILEELPLDDENKDVVLRILSRSTSPVSGETWEDYHARGRWQTEKNMKDAKLYIMLKLEALE